MSWISRLLLLVSSATVCLASSSPKFLFLNHYCGETVTVKGSTILRSTIFQDNDCRVTLVADSGNNLVAHFNIYKQTSGVAALAHLITGDCSSEYIQLYNDVGGPKMGRNGYCKSVRPTNHYELGQSGRFEYHGVFLKYINFELLITETYKKSSSDEECPAGQFDCEWEDNCVDEDLKCNGYNDCGSDVDETVGCGQSSGVLSPVYVSDYCGRTVTVKRSVILRSSIFQDNNCEVRLQASSGNNLVAHFNTYNQTSGPAVFVNIISPDCSSEYIQLYDDLRDKLMGRNGYCKSVRPTDHYELGQSGRFLYHGGFQKYITFDLLITETYKKSTSDQECPAGQFDCEWEDNCVDEELKCNGYNDCGSNDDETIGCGQPSSFSFSTLSLFLLMFCLLCSMS